MTLVDRLLVQYSIVEIRTASLEELTFVTSCGNGAIKDYFDHATQLEQ